MSEGAVGQVDYGWMAIVPPLMAIGLALALRRVTLSLASGVVIGGLIATDFQPWAATKHVVTNYLWPTLIQPTNLRILAFAFVLGGMIRLLSASGGSASLAQWVTRYASNRQRGQLTAWLLGIVFFFDDYANTLFVGSSMRGISDRLRISRAKLAFIVDATAAPIASIAPLSSWIIVEVAYIADQFRGLGIEADAYATFLATIPLRFYPIWMLALGVLVAVLNRDFGPMLTAERRALRGDVGADEVAPASVPPHEVQSGQVARKPAGVSLAFAPLLTALATILVGLPYNGYRNLLAARETASEPRLAELEPSIGTLLSHASSSTVLLWAVLAGGAVALAMAVRSRHMSWRGAIVAWLRGGREMLAVLTVLLLAWMLGAVCRDLETAQYLVALLGQGFPAGLLPTAVFFVSGLISFGTGTSWGTMGILFPLAVPLSHALAPGDHALMLGSIASILAGSVFGDHCSPISDTTIMSAMASGCPQLEHVRTQLPYALLAGGLSMLFGTLPVGMGWWGPGVGLLLGSVVLVLIVRWWGQSVELE